ncbi:hypothetical protein K502DRAFT_325238 [Neoconidiobolus thromboides FSU 785]|nr:hypothetical protein K502DRAFT_325238 [Neoconidiobolus thromboides FSU 785]
MSQKGTYRGYERNPQPQLNDRGKHTNSHRNSPRQNDLDYDRSRHANSHRNSPRQNELDYDRNSDRRSYRADSNSRNGYKDSYRSPNNSRRREYTNEYPRSPIANTNRANHRNSERSPYRSTNRVSNGGYGSNGHAISRTSTRNENENGRSLERRHNRNKSTSPQRQRNNGREPVREPTLTREPRVHEPKAMDAELKLHFSNRIEKLKNQIPKGITKYTDRTSVGDSFRVYFKDERCNVQYKDKITLNPRPLSEMNMPLLTPEEYRKALWPSFPGAVDNYELYRISIPKPKESIMEEKEKYFDKVFLSFKKFGEDKTIEKNKVKFSSEDSVYNPVEQEVSKVEFSDERVERLLDNIARFCNRGYGNAISNEAKTKEAGYIQLVEAGILKVEVLQTYLSSKKSFKSKFQLLAETSNYIDRLQSNLEYDDPPSYITSLLDLLRASVNSTAINIIKKANVYKNPYYNHMSEVNDFLFWKASSAIRAFHYSFTKNKLKSEFPKTYNLMGANGNTLKFPSIWITTVVIGDSVAFCRSVIDEMVEKLAVENFGRAPVTQFIE